MQPRIGQRGRGKRRRRPDRWRGHQLIGRFTGLAGIASPHKPAYGFSNCLTAMSFLVFFQPDGFEMWAEVSPNVGGYSLSLLLLNGEKCPLTAFPTTFQKVLHAI
jgi:hypothetical protein